MACPVDQERKGAADFIAAQISKGLSSDVSLQNLDGFYKLRLDATANIKERDVYVGFCAIVRHVALRIQQLSAESNTLNDDGAAQPSRLILPASQTDFMCSDADDSERIDIGLEHRPVDTIVYDEGSGKGKEAAHRTSAKEGVRYADLLLVVEAKQSNTRTNFDKAYVQLFRYTRKIYETQHNRRFAWGVVVCGTQVQVCAFGPNYAMASPSIDMAVSEDCAKLAGLLVNWSFCEEHVLGYDTSLTFTDEHGCWEIKVPIEGPECSNNMTTESTGYKTFYSHIMMLAADRLFGRHTRCFVATAEKPSGDNPIEFLEGNFIIKDAWPEVGDELGDCSRDEIGYLRKIRDTLGAIDELHGLYPRLEAGGLVRIKLNHEADELFEDTTRNIFSRLDSNSTDREIPVRVHKRIAMSPVGKPLRELTSVHELVIVMADAMRCHDAILRHCDVLHRDISPNNILFTRDKAGMIQGMLIDFDHAIRGSVENGQPHAERTGTLPFMSVANLEGSKHRRTALDDWESVIYMLCWFGVFGLNQATTTANRVAKHPQIDKWL
ncbi:hypothetical protein H4217_000530, partial [Coemansia sp. RSA 1939]